MTEDQLRAYFTYHMPTDQQIQDMQDLREEAFTLCAMILTRVPNSADRTAAIRKIRQALMLCNAAIVLDGKV